MNNNNRIRSISNEIESDTAYVNNTINPDKDRTARGNNIEKNRQLISSLTDTNTDLFIQLQRL